MEIVPGRQRRAGDAATVYYLVQKVAAVTGRTCGTRGRRSTRTTSRPSASR